MKMKPTYVSASLMTGALLMAATTLFPSVAANPNQQPEVTHVYFETDENNAIYGDSAMVIYNQSMLINANPHPLAGGMEDINNVPGSELDAPAEYPHHRGNATGKKAAKNYRVKITPGPYSRTQAFEGSWADLGGEAVYHPDDPDKRTIILIPANKAQPIFEPGDQIELTVAATVKNPHGLKMKPNKSKGRHHAS